MKSDIERVHHHLSPQPRQEQYTHTEILYTIMYNDNVIIHLIYIVLALETLLVKDQK